MLRNFNQSGEISPNLVTPVGKYLKLAPISMIGLRHRPVIFLSNVAASVTRLGDFWKILVTNFLTKVAQIIEDFLGFLEGNNC